MILEILTYGVLWLAAAFVLGSLVGQWLARGSGQWLLDEWERDDA